MGIVQEQHSERTRLYQQWRQFQWPIVQDSLNLLAVKVVPLVIAIDEQGVVVSHNANPDFLNRWVTEGVEVAEQSEALPAVDSRLNSIRQAYLWDREAGLDSAIADYQAWLAAADEPDPRVHFELGVCYRDRFEKKGDPLDFEKAIDHWSRALEIDPNQYIYRRRIQQYGARLGKPYPFYDWIAQARREIRERGEEPIKLQVSLSGAETASPVRRFESIANPVDYATVQRIEEDTSGAVVAKAIAVPGRVQPGAATRVHVILQVGENGKWNNEGEATQLVLQPTAGVSFSGNQFESGLPEETESVETRQFEFEVFLEENVTGPVTIQGSVLTNVCLVETGVCLYVRKPVSVTIYPRQAP